MTAPRNADDGDWIFDPNLSSLDRSLRRELRAEAEEVESIVAESELRERTFADAALEARNRGDTVSIATARRIFTGQLTFAGRDFVTIATESFEADLNLRGVAYMRVVQRARNPRGLARQESAGSFEMRLIERREVARVVELGYHQLEETVLGRITSVAQDHVTLLSEQREEWTVPIEAISYVIYRRRVR